MAKAALTDRAVSAAKAEHGKRVELADTRTPGLVLRVSPSGGKTWVLRYRTRTHRQMRLTLGPAAAITLHDARVLAREQLLRVCQGADPATERRQARASPAHGVRTFSDLADLYMRVCETGEWKPRGKKKKLSVRLEEQRLLNKNILPTLGRLEFETITRLEVKALLRAQLAKGGSTTVNRTQAIIRQIYNYAISEDLVQINPATGFLKFGEERPRERIWKDDELRALWAGLSDMPALRRSGGGYANVGEAMGIAIKLVLLLGQRRNEVAGMEVEELDFEAKTWRIRSERMKGSRAHMVPLSDAAIVLIQQALSLASVEGADPPKYVFPTNRLEDRAIRPLSLSLALQRAKAAMGMTADATLHDMRRTVSSNLTSERCGVSPFIRSKVLGHIDSGGGAMVSMIHYDVNDYLAEKRRALEIWARVLLRIVGDRSLPDGRPCTRSIFKEDHLVAMNDNDEPGERAWRPGRE
ncbi:MAG: site-specific integrase [Brevundimonas sp.]|nr:MAG: site-specific integrase [Brevundimonas sp.]